MSEDNEHHPAYLAFGRGFVSSTDNYGEADAIVKRNGNGCVYVSEHVCDKRDMRYDAEVEHLRSLIPAVSAGVGEQQDDGATVEACLAELREMFPDAEYLECRITGRFVKAYKRPHGLFVKVEIDQTTLRAGSLTECMNHVRAWSKSRAQKEVERELKGESDNG
jgi:hypothetical protein